MFLLYSYYSVVCIVLTFINQSVQHNQYHWKWKHYEVSPCVSIHQNPSLAHCRSHYEHLLRGTFADPFFDGAICVVYNLFRNC